MKIQNTEQTTPDGGPDVVHHSTKNAKRACIAFKWSDILLQGILKLFSFSVDESKLTLPR